MLKSLLPPCTMIRVQSWNGSAVVPSELEKTLGLAGPNQVGLVITGRADVMCLGPTDWLVLAGLDDGALCRALSEVLAETTFRATELSQAFSRIEVKAPYVRDLLAKGCSLDLHPRLFQEGRALRTRFAGMPVVVRCTETVAFELVVTRSCTDFLFAWLDDAALEYEAPDL
jgi:sarcosine oxidase subunit gamma